MLGHNRKMTGAECLADMLQGCDIVFRVPAVRRKSGRPPARLRTGGRILDC
jgi:hypothetical protein